MSWYYVCTNFRFRVYDIENRVCCIIYTSEFCEDCSACSRDVVSVVKLSIFMGS